MAKRPPIPAPTQLEMLEQLLRERIRDMTMLQDLVDAEKARIARGPDISPRKCDRGRDGEDCSPAQCWTWRCEHCPALFCRCARHGGKRAVADDHARHLYKVHGLDDAT